MISTNDLNTMSEALRQHAVDIGNLTQTVATMQANAAQLNQKITDGLTRESDLKKQIATLQAQVNEKMQSLLAIQSSAEWKAARLTQLQAAKKQAADAQAAADAEITRLQPPAASPKAASGAPSASKP